jgi:hypothetical protein
MPEGHLPRSQKPHLSSCAQWARGIALGRLARTIAPSSLDEEFDEIVFPSQLKGSVTVGVSSFFAIEQPDNSGIATLRSTTHYTAIWMTYRQMWDRGVDVVFPSWRTTALFTPGDSHLGTSSAECPCYHFVLKSDRPATPNERHAALARHSTVVGIVVGAHLPRCSANRDPHVNR